MVVQKIEKLLKTTFLIIFVSGFVLSTIAQSQNGYQIEIKKHIINISGKAQKLHKFYYPYKNFGHSPQIAISANKDNSYQIAWLDKESNLIKISQISAHHKLIREVVPEYIGETELLSGFTGLPNKGGYIIGYSKDNAYGEKGMEYWITYCTPQGEMVFNTRIFGEKSKAEVGSDGEPCDASTARIVYSAEQQAIFFITGHSRKWDDGIRHQGSFIGKLNMKGELSIIDSWYVSHDFDQRLINKGEETALLFHGDGYPRALGFATINKNKYNDRYNANKRIEYFKIEGEMGDNKTDAQTGGIIGIGEHNYAIAFSTGQGFKKRRLGFTRITTGNGITQSKIKWFSPQSDGNVITPKIALRDKGRILLAYEEFAQGDWSLNYLDKGRPGDDPGRMGTYFLEVDYYGNALSKPMRVDNVILQPMHDMLRLPNGNIIWAAANVIRTEDWGFPKTETQASLMVYEIDRIQNNRRLYDAYDSTKFKHISFDEKSGGFVLVNRKYGSENELFIDAARQMAKKGNRIVITNQNFCLVNDSEEWEFIEIKKLKKKELENMERLLKRKGNKIIAIHKTMKNLGKLNRIIKDGLKQAKDFKRAVFANGSLRYYNQ